MMETSLQKRELQTAYHEAGHIVTLYLLTGNIDRIDFVDIIAKKGRLGVCKDKKNSHIRENKEIFDKFGENEYFDIYDNIEYDTPEGFKTFFIEVCYALGGGISAMQYCGLKRLPRNSMGGDFDFINRFAEKVLPYKIDKSGIAYYPGLNSIIEAGTQFLKSLLSSYKARKKIKVIAEALLKYKKISKSKAYKLLREN